MGASPALSAIIIRKRTGGVKEKAMSFPKEKRSEKGEFSVVAVDETAKER